MKIGNKDLRKEKMANVAQWVSNNLEEWEGHWRDMTFEEWVDCAIAEYNGKQVAFDAHPDGGLM